MRSCSIRDGRNESEQWGTLESYRESHPCVTKAFHPRAYFGSPNTRLSPPGKLPRLRRDFDLLAFFDEQRHAHLQPHQRLPAPRRRRIDLRIQARIRCVLKLEHALPLHINRIDQCRHRTPQTQVAESRQPALDSPSSIKATSCPL